MAQSRKIIKERIKSIRNTRKITKAMELVAASKMRRAVAAVAKTRPYAKETWATIRSLLVGSMETEHALLKAQPEATKTLVVLMTSDRGLAGGFNVNMIRAVLKEIKALGTEQVEVIGLGKRGADAVERAGATVIARFPSLTNNPTFYDLLPVARLVLERFLHGECREVKLAFTDFVSGISQVPRIIDLLPLRPTAEEGEKAATTEFTFEPSPGKVLDRVLPAVAETMLYQALLETSASEHAARMMAMKNASDAARDMLDALTFTYNQARQASITQEIAEISSGKAALE